MEFTIEVSYQGKKYKYNAAFIRRTISYELFHVFGNNGKMELENNGPTDDRHGIKLPAHWTVVKGQLQNKEFEKLIIEQMSQWREENKNRLPNK